MSANTKLKDTTGPSRDGHEFHEAWAARKAMQLLLPQDGLIGIAVEGLSEADESRLSQEAVDVADLTLYYGKDTNFNAADRIEIIQSKYSPKQSHKDFRASHAKNTVEKFAKAYLDHIALYGQVTTSEKLFFELITNRPIYPKFLEAINGLASKSRLKGEPLKQANQFEVAAGLTGNALREFASKFLLMGMSGSLTETKGDLRKILVDWSAASDATARARLGDVRNMVRKKAGYEEEHLKMIRQVDVLSALELSDIDDLLPCPASLVNVGQVVAREQLSDALALLPSLFKPLLVHAEGGAGKTVFLESLASSLSGGSEVVFFDCFGGGAYRSPEDGRHLANRGLIHIANELACRSLCDPMLPGSGNSELLFSTFRKRLTQCIETLAIASKNRNLIIFIDAIDNAAEYAKERVQQAFPTQLLESFERSGPVAGVKLVVSCRTHRIERSVGDLSFVDFRLKPFTLIETTAYLRPRVEKLSNEEIHVAKTRSGGNARILEHLVSSDRGLFDVSEIHNPIVLDEMLQKRIDDALVEALRRGYSKKEVNAFLAGLSVLPPPVPLKEYAEAHGMEIAAIQSFAADLAPLLEQTAQGMTFRDEPTETLVRENYGSQITALRAVARNLIDRQDKSVYAARSLPGLLLIIGDGGKLFKLAFDDRFPPAISSITGQRRIRHARLIAAVVHAAEQSNNNSLARLLVELSSIAASDQKGADFILDNPDLVVNAQDSDALRRLFETRTSWPGARHARLTIANLLSGANDEAVRHYRNTREWVRHDLQSDNDEYNSPRPERIDRSAIPLYLILQGQQKYAMGFMSQWYDWYAYELCEELCSLMRCAVSFDNRRKKFFTDFIRDKSLGIGCLTGALSFSEFSGNVRRDVIARLGLACKRKSKYKFNGSMSNELTYDFADGLRKCAAIAISLGMNQDALVISLRAPHERPRIWNYLDNWTDRGSFPYLFRCSLVSAAKSRDIFEYDLLPQELLPYAKGVARSASCDQLKTVIKRRIDTKKRKEWEKNKDEAKRKSYTDLMSNTDRFFDYRLPSFLDLTRAMCELLRATRGSADKRFKALLDVWANIRKNKENHRYYQNQFNPYFQSLGLSAVLFVLWSRADLKAVSIRRFITLLDEQKYLDPAILIQLVSIINHNRRLDEIAVEQAASAKSLIDKEDNVETRSSLYAQLARAILPVSQDDSAEYFRVGLEQLDSIGSGDYSFTNELLCFASSVKGKELPDKDFHKLTNLCELNMSFDEHKFPWGVFGAAMSKTAGVKGLAKVSRWHDREKIDFSYTLLPYLTSLVKDRKISPKYALSLNRLAAPVELWHSGSTEFGKALQNANTADPKPLFSEFIGQYLDNNPGISSSTTVKQLAEIASKELGSSHTLARHLKQSYPKFHEVIREGNDNRNYHPRDVVTPGALPQETQSKSISITGLASKIDPLSEEGLQDVVEIINQYSLSRDEEQEFFNCIRKKVSVRDRALYIKMIARVEHMEMYAKEHELEHCKAKWSSSSPALVRTYKELALWLLEIHAEEFLSHDHLSGYHLKKLAEMTGVSMQALAVELVKMYTKPDWSVPASAWIGLATIIVENADEGHGQKALSRLLNSDTAKLTDTVVDGPWQRGYYPNNDALSVAVGLVWQSLASPRGSDRWFAMHSICTFARFGCWEVVDGLVKELKSKDSKSFQAPEFSFYYLHARLWLLIALARIAHDYPNKVGAYESELLSIALNPRETHVLMKHFAAQALLKCEEEGAITLSSKVREKIQSVNQSQLPKRKGRSSGVGIAYGFRPEDAPDSKHEFWMDYDYDKNNVQWLAKTFAAQGWKVEDQFKEIAHGLDPSITSMYETNGRELWSSQEATSLPRDIHSYGHYLAWHSIYIAAGQLLKTHPVSDDWDLGQPWTEWLESNLLTRRDGLWLSDGMDHAPIDTNLNLMEQGKDGLVLSGCRKKILNLVGIRSQEIADELVVEGDWKSYDGVNIHISSALVPTRRAKSLAKDLINEDPDFVWLPNINCNSDDEHYVNDKDGFIPWIVIPNYSPNDLDEHDPLSVIEAGRRPYFDQTYTAPLSITSTDPFKRTFQMPRRKLAAHSQAWGSRMSGNEKNGAGVRLNAKPEFLQKVLESNKVDLLVLIRLHHNDSRGSYNSSRKSSDTVAVLRVKKNLKHEYFKGAINKLRTPGYW